MTTTKDWTDFFNDLDADDGNKVSIALRSRNTKSPNSWVEDLKTFNRFIVTYHRYFDTIRF